MDWEATWQILVDKLMAWLQGLILMLPNFVLAILVVALSVVLARLTRRVTAKVLRHVSQYRHVNNLLATTSYVIVFCTGIFIALGILDLDKTVTSLLAGVGILGLALGFAFQDIASNFISGILLSIRRPFKESDIIESNEHMGYVEAITLRSTRMRTFEGQIVIIPNREVFQSSLINYTALGSRRVDIACGVSYADDLERARAVATEAVSKLEYRDKSRDVELFYDEFGESSINFKLRFWVAFRKQPDFLSAQSEAIIRIKQSFDAAGLTIPFPIRTLDFGISGGKELSQMLPPQAGSRGDESAPGADGDGASSNI